MLAEGLNCTSRVRHTDNIEVKYPSASKKLKPFDPFDGMVIPAVATKKYVRKEIFSFHTG